MPGFNKYIKSFASLKRKMGRIERAKLQKRRGLRMGTRPIRPTILEVTEEEYTNFMDRFYANKSNDEQNMNRIRSEFKERRIAKGKRI